MKTLKLHNKGKYTIVEIDNGKVNAVTDELMADLDQAFKGLENDPENKGAILAGRDNCFSAGLDVVKLATGGEAYARNLWKHFLNATRSMVTYSKPFVCAITGYAPAAATVIALCADYRIMAKGEKHVIGLQEFNMSLPIPQTMIDIYAYHMGEKYAWEAIQFSKTFTSDEAKQIGLANESCEPEEVLPSAEKALKKLMYVNHKVYAKTKSYTKQGLISLVEKDPQPIIEDIIKQGSEPEIQQMLAMFMASIKK